MLGDLSGKISCLAFLLSNNYIDAVAINLVWGLTAPINKRNVNQCT